MVISNQHTEQIPLDCYFGTGVMLGQRVIIAGFPIRWVGGDGSMVRLVAIIEE